MRMYAQSSGAILMLLLLQGGCPLACPPTPPTPPAALTPVCQDDGGSTAPESGYLWLAADMDATVICEQAAANPTACPPGNPGDTNFGSGPEVAIADRSPLRRRAYARFYLPGLPAGVGVVSAYPNLYDGRPNSGTEPVVTLTGSRAVGPWSAMTVTWNNQPNAAQTGQGEFNLQSPPTAWTRSQNVIPVIDIAGMINGSAPNNGFLFHYQQLGAGPFEGSYPSDNNSARTGASLDNAPRLLLQLTQPVSCAQLTLPPLAADSDLPQSIQGPSVLMVRTAFGTEWPTSWMVGIWP